MLLFWPIFYCQGQVNNTMETEQAVLKNIEDAYNYISGLLPANYAKPQVGIICGSGLSGLGKMIEEPITIAYSHIPNLPRASVEGHQNALKVGKIKGVVCMAFLGRFHGYEGLPHRSTTRCVRILARMGVPHLIITNSSGSINTEICETGDFLVVEDHVSLPGLAGQNPLTGPNLGGFGPRFPAVNQVYHQNSYELVLEAARLASVPATVIKKGTYVHIAGPSYETPAEVRFLRILGGAAVGMSTVPEVIVAAHCKQIKDVVVLALITNEPFGPNSNGPTHEEVLAVAAARAIEFQKIVVELVGLLTKPTDKHNTI